MNLLICSSLLALASSSGLSESRIVEPASAIVAPENVAPSAEPVFLTYEDYVAARDLIATHPEQEDAVLELLGVLAGPPVWVECGDSANFFTNGVTAQGLGATEAAAIAAAKAGALLALNAQSNASCKICPVPGACWGVLSVLPANWTIVTACDPKTGLWLATATYNGGYVYYCSPCPMPPQ